MESTRKSEPSRRRPRRASSLEGRENQVIAEAVDLAEQQIRDGSASAQVISHYLKLSSTRERLEQERLRNENLLTKAKIEGMEAQQRIEGLYEEAIKAFRGYSGDEPDEEFEYED